MYKFKLWRQISPQEFSSYDPQYCEAHITTIQTLGKSSPFDQVLHEFSKYLNFPIRVVVVYDYSISPSDLL